jgi:hypothetical protein
VLVCIGCADVQSSLRDSDPACCIPGVGNAGLLAVVPPGQLQNGMRYRFLVRGAELGSTSEAWLFETHAGHMLSAEAQTGERHGDSMGQIYVEGAGGGPARE